MELKLPSKVLMIDAEFTGLDPKEHEILELSAVKCLLDEDTWQYRVNPITFSESVHSDLRPKQKFHIEHLTPAYDKANASTNTYSDIRSKLESFIGDWKGEAWACGDCVFTDLLFMHSKGLLTINSYTDDDEIIPGTIDYRPFEMKPLKVLAQSMGWNKPQDELREHDSLNDCFNQIKELNSLLSFFKNLTSKT